MKIGIPCIYSIRSIDTPQCILLERYVDLGWGSIGRMYWDDISQKPR